MKKSILFLFAALAFAFNAESQVQLPKSNATESKVPESQGYSVNLQAPNYKSGLAYLCYYMGKSMNIEDSAMMTPAGTTVFKGSKTLPGGIYTVVFPGKRLTLDFFVDKEQEMEKSGKNEYVLTTDEVENFTPSEIKSTFNDYEEPGEYQPLKF